ncbi:MAG: hypothetical protein R3231_01480 [bacterium]|nr:hypothetical protein [bacterium]
MSTRKGIYWVKTDKWYVERLVWLIAGTDVLVSSILTVLHSPYWIFSILFVGVCSMLVALTGFCLVGNLVYRLGAEARLLRQGVPSETEASLYLMQTDKWFLERFIYLFVGVNLSLSSLLATFHSLYWLCFTGFVGSATVVFAFTGYCFMANLLYKLGAEPRLGRSLEMAAVPAAVATTPPRRVRNVAKFRQT